MKLPQLSSLLEQIKLKPASPPATRQNEDRLGLIDRSIDRSVHLFICTIGVLATTCHVGAVPLRIKVPFELVSSLINLHWRRGCQKL